MRFVRMSSGRTAVSVMRLGLGGSRRGFNANVGILSRFLFLLDREVVVPDHGGGVRGRERHQGRQRFSPSSNGVPQSGRAIGRVGVAVSMLFKVALLACRWCMHPWLVGAGVWGTGRLCVLRPGWGL